jgi:CelD/BcsL family acetyltransferase involved in cellulose biosynthesis
MNALMTSFDTNQQNLFADSGGLHLRVYADIEDVRDVWLRLEQSGVSTIYQSFGWCSVWLKHYSTLKNIQPCIVVAENEYGVVEFILPLQRRTSKGLQFIEMLTAPQAGYGFGIFNRSFMTEKASSWFANHFESVIAALPQHDIFQLNDLPAALSGHNNPLLATTTFIAANQCHIMGLEPDYNALYERRRSLVSRKSIRKRDNKLEAIDGMIFDIPSTEQELTETIQTMFLQQEMRLAESGIHNVFDKTERQFYSELAIGNARLGPVLQPFRLRVNNEIIAILLGGYHQDTYFALISSMSEGELKRFSPGDYILRRIIQTLCGNGTKLLDFSAGDSPYKYHWSEQQIPLHFILRCNSAKGFPVALFLLAREKLKRVCKQTPGLNTALFSLRRILKGRKAAS